MKKYNPRKTIRIPPLLIEEIGDVNFSQWVVQAVKLRLQDEKGLTPVYEKRLMMILKNIIALGRNLNQLTRSVNSGRPVTVSDQLLKEILREIQKARKEIGEVRAKL